MKKVSDYIKTTENWKVKHNGLELLNNKSFSFIDKTKINEIMEELVITTLNEGDITIIVI